MENRITILEELKGISPAVAAISNRNVYSIPPGYFDRLAEEILLQVYTRQLPKTSIPFTVPPGFFENLPQNIIARIKSGDLQGNLNPYSVPVSYFESLSDSILQKIRQNSLKEHNEIFEELEQVAPLLNTIHRKIPYQVPENYFEDFKVNRPVAKPSKVFSLTGSVRTWTSYVAAACILTIIALSSYFLFNNRTNIVERRISKLIEQSQRANVENGIAVLTEEEIKSYLNSQNIYSSDLILPSSGEEPDIQQLLDNSTDEEIQEYLNDNQGLEEENIKGI